MKLFETIAINNGQILNKSYHNKRFVKGQLFLNKNTIIQDIQELINIPNHLQNSFIRCRITYDKYGIDIGYFEYIPKLIQSFKLVYHDDIDYRYKYDDRRLLNELLAKKEHCDDIIIIKNGYVSDCSIGNLLFFDNKKWVTPDTPLLQGTQRQYLLDNKKIQLASIGIDDIKTYKKIMMINALNSFDENRAIDIDTIIF